MRTILAAAAALFLSSAAYADTITTLDPLHGVCNGTGVGTCSDNGTNTPLGNSTLFGFTSSPPNQTGDLTIDVLIPNNDAIPALTVTQTAGGSASGVFTQFINPTLGAVWNANDLAINFLGEAGASPNNPIGAYLPSTDAVDHGATGFFVLRVDLGSELILAFTGDVRSELAGAGRQRQKQRPASRPPRSRPMILVAERTLLEPPRSLPPLTGRTT